MEDESVTMCGQHVPAVGRRKALTQDSEPRDTAEQVSVHDLYARV